MRVFGGLAAAIATLMVLRAPGISAVQRGATEPLAVARALAARYPAQPIMSYIPALSRSAQMRLSELTGEPQWREKALKDMEPFTTKKTPAVAEPYRLTSLAGALAFHDAWIFARDTAAQGIAQVTAMAIAPPMDPAAPPSEEIKFKTGWTDDMFMVSAVLSRIGAQPHAEWMHRRLRDVCSATGSGPTKEYYLNRPVVNGADDRGGAMALLAAIEMEMYQRAATR